MNGSLRGLVLGGQEKHGVEFACGTIGTAEHANGPSNVLDEEPSTNQRFYDVGGDGFEPPTPAL
jgi:hypothetical protein